MIRPNYYKPDFYTIPQAAEFLRMTPATVRNWVRTGRLKRYRFPGGKEVRVDMKEIISKMEEQGEEDQYCRLKEVRSGKKLVNPVTSSSDPSEEGSSHKQQKTS